MAADAVPGDPVRDARPGTVPAAVRPRRRTHAPALENDAERALFPGFEPTSTCGIVRCLAHGFPTLLNRWHYHPEYELHLIVATRGRAFVGDHVGAYEPGHLVLCGPGLPHNWLVDDLPPGGIDAPIHRVLQFRDEPLREAARALDAVEEIFPMLDRARHGIEFFGLAAQAEARFEAIRASHGLQRVALFLGWLAELGRCTDHRLLSAAAVQGQADAGTRQASEMIAFVARHAFDDLSLQDAAGRFGMSAKYFSKRFRQVTGNAFIDFVVRLRIEQAARLLAETDQYVAGICLAVGFNNVANFNRHFMRLKGMTPTAFRRQAGDRFGDGYLGRG
jgi:AraC-like DNA-binding protein